MTKTLTDLVAELQEDVPAVSSVPSDAQYERAVKDAVREFSRRCGVVKNGTLAVVSGTAAYALPADFLDLIEIDDPFDPEHQVMVTATGIIPFSSLAPFEEDFSIQNGTITFFPVPTYTMTRYYEYKAAWVLDVNNAYPLTEDEARIVMLKAKQLVFDKLANASAGAGFKYTVGNMSVDKSGMADGYSKRLYELQGEFLQACDNYNGAVIR
jgi:hypothetical protein